VPAPFPLRPITAAKKIREFDPDTFLATIGDGKRMVAVPKKQTIFAQGDDADAIFYIQRGKVRLSVVSKTGKEATIGVVSEENFFGEGSLADQIGRMGSAATMTDCELLRIEEGNDVGTSPRTCLFRFVRGVSAGAEYPLRSRPG